MVLFLRISLLTLSLNNRYSVNVATINVGESDFEDKVLKSGTPVLVDFWAEWCAPCKMAEPVLEELSDIYAGKAVIAKVDVEANQALAQKYTVLNIPTTVMFVNGQEKGRQVGFGGKEPFEKLIKENI